MNKKEKGFKVVQIWFQSCSNFRSKRTLFDMFCPVLFILRIYYIPCMANHAGLELRIN